GTFTCLVRSCGLATVRAASLRVANEPKPGHVTLSPFIAVLFTSVKNASRTRSASVFETPARFATASSNSAFVMLLGSSFCLAHARSALHENASSHPGQAPVHSG